jgi:hypothetical protein
MIAPSIIPSPVMRYSIDILLFVFIYRFKVNIFVRAEARNGGWGSAKGQYMDGTIPNMPFMACIKFESFLLARRGMKTKAGRRYV